MNNAHSTSLRGWLASVLTVLLVASGVSIGAAPALADSDPSITVEAEVHESPDAPAEAPPASEDSESDTLDADPEAMLAAPLFTMEGSGEESVSGDEEASAVLSVSKASGLDPEGEEITVTGSGYTIDPAGVYAQVGWIKPGEWTPLSAEETRAENRVGVATAWISGPRQPVWVVAEDGTGSFTWTTTVTKAAVDEKAKDGFVLAAFTLGAHGNWVQPENEKFVALSFAEPSVLSVSKASGLDPEGEEITVTGSGYTIDPAGVYAQVGWIKPGEWTPLSAEETRAENRVGVATAWISGPRQPVWVVAEDGTGSFTWTTTVTKAAVDEKAKDGFVLAAFTLGAHGNWVQPENEKFIALSFAGAVEPPAKPVTPPVTKPVAAGSFSWGVKQSFRDYVSGPIAAGSISTTNVRSTGSSFVFGQATGGTFNGSTGTSNYSGSVRFVGHGGVLDLTLANPVVRIDSSTSGTLLLRVNGATVPFATLALGSGSRSVTGGATSFTGVSATLTAAGAAAFVNGDSQFYPAGTALDRVSFVIGAPSSPATGTRTVSAFVAPTAVPPTPPATSGITMAGADPHSLGSGDQVTITAGGFEAGERGIRVVIYSDPIVLATDATADASGVVTWTGFLPEGLTGSHTLTLQGSVDRGIELTIAETAVLMASGCVADAATLTWGFKEAFRSYISSTIANGEWSVADGATYETPNFGWSDGVGSYDGAAETGELSFDGSIRFTGHGGILDTTLANPQLRFDGDGKATLLLDVTGTTRDGEEVNELGVEFATVDLAAAEKTVEDAQLSFAGAPTVLTAAGSEAFGTYPAGEVLDPITVAFSSECAAPDTGAPAPEEGDASETTEPTDLGWLIWAGATLLVVAAAIATTILVMRRRAA